MTSNGKIQVLDNGITDIDLKVINSQPHKIHDKHSGVTEVRTVDDAITNNNNDVIVNPVSESSGDDQDGDGPAHKSTLKQPSHRRTSKSQRAKINMRERRRMHDLNKAMDSLREVIPYAYGPSVRKLSKIGTLSLARNYILMLTKSVEDMKRLLDDTFRSKPRSFTRRSDLTQIYNPYSVCLPGMDIFGPRMDKAIEGIRHSTSSRLISANCCPSNGPVYVPRGLTPSMTCCDTHCCMGTCSGMTNFPVKKR